MLAEYEYNYYDTKLGMKSTEPVPTVTVMELKYSLPHLRSTSGKSNGTIYTWTLARKMSLYACTSAALMAYTQFYAYRSRMQ